MQQHVLFKYWRFYEIRLTEAQRGQGSGTPGARVAAAKARSFESLRITKRRSDEAEPKNRKESDRNGYLNGYLWIRCRFPRLSAYQKEAVGV